MLQSEPLPVDPLKIEPQPSGRAGLVHSAERLWTPAEKVLLWLLMVLAFGLRVWELERNGFGHPYYGATVRSMLAGWHHFFYASFDPAGFLTVDKPPVAFWIQAAFARFVGFTPLAVHLPQALEGTAAVLLVVLLVRPAFGGAAGLLAGVVLALMPVSVAVDRSNLPDSCLVFFLLLSAWAFARATRYGRLALLICAAVLVGVAFNVKLMAAMVILPTLYLVYLLGAPIRPARRVLHLAVVTPVLALVALSWSLAVDATPAAKRPYVGDTQDNSMLTMAIGTSGPLSGIGRAIAGGPRPQAGSPGRDTRRGPPPPGPPDAGEDSPSAGDRPGGSRRPPVSAENRAPEGGPEGPGRGPPGAGAQLGHGGPPGMIRLFVPHMVEQFGWMLPLGLLGLPVAFLTGGPDQRRAQRLDLLKWTGWLFSYLLVLSFMRNVIHNYYLAMIAPAVAAMVGISLVSCWHLWRRRPAAGMLVWSLAFLATACWQAFILRSHPDWRAWLLPFLAGGIGLCVVGLWILHGCLRGSGKARWVVPMLLTLGVSALLLSPAAWALTPVRAKGHPALPMAYPGLLRGEGVPFQLTMRRDQSKLIEFLRAHRHGERFLLVTPDIHTAAPLIIETGEPIVALGGFTGTDPTLTVERFARLVEEGQVRFVLTGSFRGARRSRISEIFQWVRARGRRVPPGLWAGPQPSGSGYSHREGETGDSGARLPFGIRPPLPVGSDRRRPPGRNPGALELFDCRPGG